MCVASIGGRHHLTRTVMIFVVHETRFDLFRRVGMIGVGTNGVTPMVVMPSRARPTIPKQLLVGGALPNFLTAQTARVRGCDASQADTHSGRPVLRQW